MSDVEIFKPRTILAGRYQIRRELGRGGMGVVYLCRDLVADERVALKLLARPGEKARAEDAWWFQEEARALAGLSHEAIVRARDFGTLADGTPYLVMDAVPGRSLHEWIYLAKHDGPIPYAIVWSVVDQVLAALAHAHARGVIHGDLKPSNVLVDMPPDGGEPTVYVLDLGLAWLLQDRVDHRLDGTREAEPTVRWGAGTPGWMAPEQIRFAAPHIGPATDLYALGCILFAMLSNKEPYDGDNDELLQRHRNGPVPEPDLPPDAPDGVKGFVVRLLQKRPWHRYEFAADARRAWRKFAPIHDAPTMPYATTQLAGPSLPPSAEASHREIAGELAASATTVGLLGLRPSPFVARTQERQRLLEVAAQVAAKGGHALVVLTGEAGVGKSRLAEWLCEEVHERGLMVPLRARYRKIAAPLDGIVGAVTAHYRLEKADRDVIEKVLMNVWDVPADDEHEKTWVAATAEWILPAAAAAAASADASRPRSSAPAGPSGKRFALDRPELRWLVIRRVFERIARRRPILLWMDDLHHASPTTFEGLVDLHKEAPHLPLFVVATARSEAVHADGAAAARLARALDAFHGEPLELAPLQAQEAHALLRETLPLDDEAAREAAERSKGNPLFALQVLHAWAMGGHLTLQGGRYSVPKASLAVRAATTAELWDERVRGVPEALRKGALAAAALGGDIRADVLKALLEGIGVDAEPAIAALKRAQILLASGDRLRWPHALLQEHLLARLFLEPDASDVFRAAAAALARHPTAQSRRIVRHRVVNLLRAGDVEPAAALLHAHTARLWGKTRDAASTLRDLALLDGKLEGLALARHLRWRAEALRHAGRLDDARREAEEARALFADAGSVTDEASCLRALGHIASDMAAPAHGRRLVARALALYQELGDEHGMAECEVVLGEIDFLL
ncbi:MAG TPA: protein kinase, partial [Minicystis sp.]|nr:protein kinase [Minicystis sp.]